jgi:tripeptidyl-peptidase-2
LPTNKELRALTGQRDSLPKNQQPWELVLTYEFELDENAKVLPRPALAEDGEVWESFESMLWTIFDSNKRRIDDGPQNDPVSLKKGKHTVRFHVRHPDEATLRKLERMPLSPAARAAPA